MGGTVLQCFCSDRSPKVVLGECCSTFWSLAYGVPQESWFSPMKFNRYIKLLGDVIRRFGLSCHLYAADDTKLYFTFPLDAKGAFDTINQFWEVVMGWMRLNILKHNSGKREIPFCKVE